ncbi:MAG: LytTR family DNA-binding domain-containing protein [Oscillospiraceae bacterium]|nr:LytTR family DNA-binding domain-containing protein [Oscillospiraceae bacterium]
MNTNINIAVCDDEAEQTEYIKAIVSKWADQSRIQIQTEMFDSAENFKSSWSENKKYDILLLDIQMSGQSGVELAKEIRKSDTKLVIIFITGFGDFISDGYDVSALHYLMKPVKEDKLFEVLDKAVKNLTQINKSVVLNVDGETIRIPLSEIRYIEAQDHYVVIRTVSHEYKSKMNLSEIQKSLDNSFFQCQRSFIVNLSFVYKITRIFIVLDNMTEIPLSRNLYEAANQAVIKFYPNE